MYECELTAADLDFASLSVLLNVADPVGVLSIFVDAGVQARGTAIDIQNRLSQLERCVAADGPAERADALSDALARLEGEIEGLCDPSASGRGRVMFAPLSGDALIRFSTQLRLRNRVMLDDRPFVHPLLESLEQGRSAGVILISRDVAELLEWRHGELLNVGRIVLDVDALSDRPDTGATRAAGHQQTTPSRERRERRSDDQRRRFADRVATAATQLASRRGWERAVISGDERLTGPLVRALPEPLRETAIRDPRHLIESDPLSLNAIVGQLLEHQQAESDLRLTERILDATRAAEGGALGLSEVLAALNDARVMHLIYDPDVRYAGAIAGDGQLSSPPVQGPLGRWAGRPHSIRVARDPEWTCDPIPEHDTALDTGRMSVLVWAMVGIALWHFAILVPDRFWGGIIGAFLAALLGALASGYALPAPGISAVNPPGLGEGLWAIPGSLAALGFSYWYGSRSGDASAR